MLDLLAGTKSKELLPHLLMQTKSKMPSTVSCEAKIDLISRQNEIMDLYLGMLTKLLVTFLWLSGYILTGRLE